MTGKRARVHPLDEDAPSSPEPSVSIEPAGEAPGSPRPDLEKSRIDLAERQRRWILERERFERRTRTGSSEPSPSESGDPAAPE